MKELETITIKGDNNKEKVITFNHNGRYNENQALYFNAIFNPDLTVKTDFSELGYFGGFRCAKSFSQQAVLYLLCSRYEKIKAVIVRDTYDQLELSVIQQFNAEFEYLGNYKYFRADRKAQFANGSVIYFRAFNYDTDILSSEWDIIAACQVEDLPKELFLQFFGRLSGKGLPRPLLLVEGNPSANYIKERYKDQQADILRSRGIYAITNGKTSDNPHITQEYIDRIKANYPEWWIARYLNSEWNDIKEMVFSEFDEARNVINPIAYDTIKHYKQRCGMDYGWNNPSAIVWAYVDYDGVITIYDEWGDTKQTGDMIKKQALRYGRFITAGDYAMKGNKDDNGKSIWDKLCEPTGPGKQDGMLLYECVKDTLGNIVLFNSLLKQGKVRITRNCGSLIKETTNWKWKKIKLGQEKNLFEEPVNKDDHFIDAALYLVNHIEGLKSQDPEIARYKTTIEYANIHSPKPNQDIKNFS